MKDYKFRYRIESKKRGSTKKAKEPVKEYFRNEIINILDIAILTSQGRELKVDGFKFINDPKKVFPIYKKRTK